MTKVVDDRGVSSDKSADRGERLTECTHDQVYVFSYTEVIASTTSAFTEYTDTVCFVNHDVCVVFLC